MSTLRRKPLATLVGTLAIVIIAACAPTAPGNTDRVESTPGKSVSPKPDEAKVPTGELTVSQVGWVSDDYSTLPYGTVKNTTNEISSVTVNFAAYDAAGKVLGTGSGSYILVRAGQTQLITGYLDIPDGSVVAKVDGQIEVSDSEVDKNPKSAMTAAQINISTDEYAGSKVTGTIASTYEQTVTDVALTAVCADPTGKIVAAGSTYLEGSVVPGSPAPYELSLTGAAPSKCIVTATPSNISEGS